MKEKTKYKPKERRKEGFVKEFDKESWKPKTKLGKQVKSGEVNNIDFVLDNGIRILESEIVDVLIPNIESELLLVGQAKGKFGGGQRRVFKQTQKKTREGNKPHFSTCAIVGNRDGYVGIGFGKSKETVPAREKAFRNARLNLIKIRRGCGSWQCGCKEPHSIPFRVEGKCGSVKVVLMPAPKGTGLKVEKESQKILSLAGIKDVWSRTSGQTKSKNNLIYACDMALRKLMDTRVNQKGSENVGVMEGSIKKTTEKVEEEDKKDE
ncbi:30S ribosomal protein S5 [Candidatus Woesearchaeota archaeon B3_Woes]|nr:MAG: 30S ribosomal protein S5 [Candidatus Woesearchaeota archaeon B3_Woes]